MLHLADNLEVMRAMDAETVDLVYLDPPFCSQRDYGEFSDIWRAEGSETRDVIESLSEHLSALEVFTGRSPMLGYLKFMAPRLWNLHRLLKPTGSLYLHCDPTMSHYLKLLLDSIFGQNNFKNEIIWQRRQDTHNLAKRHMGRNHDTIFYYAKSEKTQYNILYEEYDESYLKSHYKHTDERGSYRLLPCTNEAGGNKRYEFRGITRAWRFEPNRMQQMYESGLLVQLKDGGPFYYKKYLDEAEGVPIDDTWTDVPPARGGERVGYPTQKPLALLRRIIEASSNKGDLVLDPFCGSGTTLEAAQNLGRKWIGIDCGEVAIGLARQRLDQASQQSSLVF